MVEISKWGSQDPLKVGRNACEDLSELSKGLMRDIFVFIKCLMNYLLRISRQHLAKCINNARHRILISPGRLLWHSSTWTQMTIDPRSTWQISPLKNFARYMHMQNFYLNKTWRLHTGPSKLESWIRYCMHVCLGTFYLIKQILWLIAIHTPNIICMV